MMIESTQGIVGGVRTNVRKKKAGVKLLTPAYL
jgi:hypothetical protein